MIHIITTERQSLYTRREIARRRQDGATREADE